MAESSPPAVDILKEGLLFKQGIVFTSFTDGDFIFLQC